MREILVLCTQAQAEALGDSLLAAGALSVCVEDADSESVAETPLFGEPGDAPAVLAWQHNRVIALLPEGVSADDLMAQVYASGCLPQAAPWQERTVPDTDWVRLTQTQFGPIQVGERLWITPSWHEDDVALQQVIAQVQGAVRIRLDPGLAFGTGSHPTTHLCLDWLAQHLRAGASVLDYGCGSGILAIAARLLGAGDTSAMDIDPQAVQATCENAQRNQVSLHAVSTDVPEGVTFDVVVANILSNPLKVLAPLLVQYVHAGGHLVLSGILERQAHEVMDVYAPWVGMHVWQACDGWVCLHGQKL